jgi:glycosyltransferase involved in cell wall biosynthesis
VRIAFIGTRGVPANYGGFETFVEQLGARLADRGHTVTVYCRRAYYDETPGTYRGMRLVHLASVHTKHLDSISHTAAASLHSLREKHDIAFYCGSGSSPLCWIAKLRGAKVVLNPDGLEWQRAKWGRGARAYLKLAERFAARIPNGLVADSNVIRDYYREQYGRESEFVAYGADHIPRGTYRDRLAALGVEPERYFLFVSRLEPENNAHLVVQAFENVKTDLKLMMVGDAPFADEYIAQLKNTSDPRILFPGAIYGDDYNALRANAYAYINAMEVGGTHPAILEAMGAGNCVVVSDIAYNTEAVADAGEHFKNRDANDLAAKLQALAGDPERVAQFRTAAHERAKTHYDWDQIADDYERCFERVLAS